LRVRATLKLGILCNKRMLDSRAFFSSVARDLKPQTAMFTGADTLLNWVSIESLSKSAIRESLIVASHIFVICLLNGSSSAIWMEFIKLEKIFCMKKEPLTDFLREVISAILSGLFLSSINLL
jgi:hypothetical protein